MKTIFIWFLACLGPVLASNIVLNLKNDGSTIQGGTIHFFAEVLENGLPAAGSFRYEWEENSILKHIDTHDSNSNKDEWAILYARDKVEPGSYTTTLTAKKLINSVYVEIAKKQSSFSITRHLHGKFLVSTTATDTNYVVTHEIALTVPNEKYLKDNDASVSTYWYVDGMHYAVTNNLFFTMKYPKLYRRIGVQALVVAQLHNKKKFKNSDVVYTYIENLIQHPVINHYADCNASFPYINTNNNIKVNKNTVLGCFTRTFRLWDSITKKNSIWHQPQMISGSLDGINFAANMIRDSQNYQLERIADPFVKSIVSDRIRAINQKIPILSKENTINYNTLEERMNQLKEAERLQLDKIKDPFLKSIVEQRINEENKRLSIKSKEIDSRLKESVDRIRNKRPTLKNSGQSIIKEDPERSTIQENQYEKDNVIKSTAYNVKQRIEDLKNSEYSLLDSIDDPDIQTVALDSIHEQNINLPNLLKSNSENFDNSGVLDAIHNKIDNEIRKSSDVSLDDIENSALKESIKNKIDLRNQILAQKSKEIDKVLEVPLSEIREKIKNIKETENSAIENVTDSDAKEEILNAIDKENDKIPVLMLPFAMGKNFSFVLDLIRSKLGFLTDNEASVTRNVTNPIIQSMIASKFDKVNYILNTKFKLLSDSFSDVLNAVTASVDESSAETRKVPVLTKTPYSETEDLGFPASLASNFSIALDAINEKINNLKDTTNDVIHNVTIPSIQTIIVSKLDKVNSILTTKYKELSNNFTTIIDTISAKLANITADESKKNSKKPNKIPKLGLSLDDENENETLDENEMITNYTVALDKLRTKLNGLEIVGGMFTENMTNPFVPSIVSNKLNMIKFIVNTKYKQLSDNFTNFLNTISTKQSKTIPTLRLSANSDLEDISMPESLAANLSVTLDAISTRIDDLKDTIDLITQNITDPAVQALVSSKLDKLGTILNKKYQDISDSFVGIVDTINSKLTNATDTSSKKSPKKPYKIPKLGLSLDDENENETLDENELITNYTVALDKLRTKLDGLETVGGMFTENMTNPFAQSIISNKLNMIKFIVNTKYKQLSDNFTNFLSTISTKPSKTIPTLRLSANSELEDNSMPESLAANLSVTLDAISTRIDDLKGTTDLITQNITDPAVQALISSKLDKVGTILNKKYQDISDSFVGIVDTINSKLTNATDTSSKKSPKKPKKVPKLGKSKSIVTDDNQLKSSDVIANFTIALDAIRTRIDDLNNSGDVITQNITNPFAQTIVASKLDRINFILKTKYKTLNDNLTNILETINANLENASQDSTGTKKVPKLTRSFNTGIDYSTIVDLIRLKIVGKQKPSDAIAKNIKDPDIKEVVMNRIIEENKNLSTIADKIEENLKTAIDEYTKKAQDLNTLEDLTVDYVDDPYLKADIINQINEENENIPLLTVGKRDTTVTKKPIPVTPSKSMFKMKYPTVIRF